MTAAQLLQDVCRAGFALKCDGESILVAPAGQLPPDLRAAIKTHRRELLDLLREPTVSVSAGTPTPPPGARLFFSDADGRPCKAEDAYLWCWEGGPEWYYTYKNPPPPCCLVLRPDSPVRCPGCARRSLRVAWQTFSNGTNHLRCECAVCGRFIKHLKPPPDNVCLEYRLGEGVGCGT
jgi:hypothetical protein